MPVDVSRHLQQLEWWAADLAEYPVIVAKLRELANLLLTEVLADGAAAEPLSDSRTPRGAWQRARLLEALLKAQELVGGDGEKGKDEK